MNTAEQNGSALAATLAEQKTEFDGLIALGDGITDEQLTRANELADALQAGQQKLENLARLQQTAGTFSAFAAKPVQAAPFSGLPVQANGMPSSHSLTQAPQQPSGWTLPATAIRAKTTVFKDDDGRFSSKKAYGFGMWLRATLGNNRQARLWCRDAGIPLLAALDNQPPVNLAHTEEVNHQGGFLVPQEFDSDLIDLREQYGVIRGLAKNKTMASDTRRVPRRTGGLTAYVVGENTAITESTKSWDSVNLVARKIGVLSKWSNELGEDAVIDVANDLAGEISYAFATFEDDAGFNGDGTSTYAGITGVRSKLLGLSSTRADIAGLVVGSGNEWGELTLADFNYVVGRLPRYADTPNTKWVCHKTFFHSVMERLMLAAGGITDAMIASGANRYRFMGYDVEIAQKMPGVQANDVICAFLGDFSQGMMFGDRRQTTIATSEHLNFAEDEMAIRGTERFDIVVHDIGNQSGTAASRVPGPIIGLATAAS